MKFFLIIFSITLSYNIDWINDSNSNIIKINKESILKKTKSIDKKNERTLIKKYKLNEFKKIELVLSGDYADTMNFQYFTKGNFVFAELDFIIADYFQKGAYYTGRAKGEITETKQYFKNENEGIKLRRSIDYYENSNLDSLKLELQKTQFDTTLLENTDYLKIKRVFKKFNIMF